MAGAQAYNAAMARAIRALTDEENRERLKAFAELTEPYGTLAALDRISRDEADGWDYLAAIPFVGIPVRVASKAQKIAMGIRNAQDAEKMAEKAATGEYLDFPPDLQELIEEATRTHGYPRDTATRIVLGELPMDAASRKARAAEQMYDVDTVTYRGVERDRPTPVRENKGPTFSTPDARVASTYVNDPNDVLYTYPKDTPLSEMDDLRYGAVYPMVRRPNMELEVDATVDANTGEVFDEEGYGQWWNSIPRESVDADVLDEIDKRYPSRARYGSLTTDDVVKGAMQFGDYDSVRFENIDDRAMDSWGDFENYPDMEPVTATVTVDKPENLRSIYAAFDPKAKNQRNIMAGVTGVGTTALIAQLLRQMEEEERENEI